MRLVAIIKMERILFLNDWQKHIFMNVQVTAGEAEERNKSIVQMSNNVVKGYASKDGQLEKSLKDIEYTTLYKSKI
jgi:hypothetical protein